ncbi:GntR family transcriptional regulator [Achromobacter aloeverae]|uniref:GntR family transcriptional regulator n=1 Tax=Achromobacter aloeverae TaxID=1750518 RepID=A0A4V1MRF1_9BURK|nr:GntR family transcriptional regulator [Achromobacter aloeverae]RXN83717.1 GntR family transcriptional regulator [Achromobacter aloeverae]
MNQGRQAPPRAARRAADIAHDRLESLIATLQLAPGSAVAEAALSERIGLGRTPVREALLRMVAAGLIRQEPRRGLRVAAIELAEHLNVLQTRRVLEQLIAGAAARRATPAQREAIRMHAARMRAAADAGDLDLYMAADQALDAVCHEACRNISAVNAVAPLVIQCRRFWYAYRHEGDLLAGARQHGIMADGIATGDAAVARQGADALMDYLDAFTRKVIDA